MMRIADLQRELDLFDSEVNTLRTSSRDFDREFNDF